MSAYILKPADEALSHVLDWRHGYLQTGETVVDDLGWTIHPCDGGPRALFVGEQHHDFYRSWAEFRGGVPGRFHLVSARVQTSRDRVLMRSVVLRVALGLRPN